MAHPRLVSAAQALMLLAIAALAGPVSAAADPAPYSIVVLGDSYSAGNGAGEYYGAAGCFRSRNNYGEQYARMVTASLPEGTDVQVRTEACSGAVTGDYWAKKKGRPPQREALSSSADIVFMTFGGNDLGFADIVKQCLVGASDNETQCNAKIQTAQNMINLGTIGARLQDVLLDASQRTREDVKIVLIGYPYLEIDSTLKFGEIALGSKLYELSDAGDRVQAEAVARLNKQGESNRFVFVSTQDLFAGRSSWLPQEDQLRHELYKESVNAASWMIHPFWDASIATKSTYYHPDPEGWARLGELLRRTDSLDPRPVITTTGVLNGSVGVYYRLQLTTSDNRPGSWSVSEAQLPPGITLTSDGLLIGTPMGDGAYPFTVQFTDSRWGMTAIRNLTLKVASEAVVPTRWLNESPPLPENGVSFITAMSNPVCDQNSCGVMTRYLDAAGRERVGVAFRVNDEWHAADLSEPEGYPATGAPNGYLYCMEGSDCIAVVGTQWWARQIGEWKRIPGAVPIPWSVSCGVNACLAFNSYGNEAPRSLQLHSYTTESGWTTKLAPMPGDRHPTDPWAGTFGACGEGVCAVSSSYLIESGQRKAVFWTSTDGGPWVVQSSTFADGEAVDALDRIPVACGTDFCVVVSPSKSSTGLPGLWRWQPGPGWEPESRAPAVPTGASDASYWNAACGGAGCLVRGSVGSGTGQSSDAVWSYAPNGEFSRAPDPPDAQPSTLGTPYWMDCSRSSCSFTGRYNTTAGTREGGLWRWSTSLGWQASAWAAPEGYPVDVTDYWNFSNGVACSSRLCVAYSSPGDAESYAAAASDAGQWSESLSLKSPTDEFVYINGGDCSANDCLLLGNTRNALPARWMVWSSS